MIDLKDKLTVLPGIGEKSAEHFAKLGVNSVEELLLYFPFRYEDFAQKSILDLQDGEKVVLTGIVVTPARVEYYGAKRNRLRFAIKQSEAVIGVSFFNQPYLAERVVLGQEVILWGKWDKAKASLSGMKMLGQIGEELQPVYHVIKGVSQASLVKAVKTAIDKGYVSLIEETLPKVLLDRYQLIGRQEAVYAMHFPDSLSDYRQALRRLKFEELFLFQMRIQLLKREEKQETHGLVMAYHQLKLEKKVDELPFVLTDAQNTSLEEILSDMNSSRRMNRLLQGDVGSGKTVVAGLAMFASYTAGFQSALMVPTEILAEQHRESLEKLFPECRVALVTGSMKVSEKKRVLSAIETGQVDMIVGTHSLIQEGVDYHRLGLVIIDEQHRFGVQQRRLLREKGENPDVLMMTATPIPRTLAITAFGDMDVSVIHQLPAGRKPIVTRWVKHEQLSIVMEWLAKEIEKGAQAYVISPLIEESESLDLKNAVALEEELKEFFGSNIAVELLHGKMKTDEKEVIMDRFKSGQTAVLVSTTVIEVGVDVPNASVMVIMDADRFGLSQLHQLRGRVGRGDKQSYAILVANPKTESGKKRMSIMTETVDGFVLAEQDLKMRGSGEIFGTRQSGLPEFQVANIVEDYAIVEEARKVAHEIISDSQWRSEKKWAILAKTMSFPQRLD